MNTASVITASVFSVLSIAVLIYLFIGKSEFAKGKYKGFYRACCGVYVSGALLVLLFTIVLKGLPVAFVVISDNVFFWDLCSTRYDVLCGCV